MNFRVISGDIMRDLLEWLPLRKLRNIALTNKRFWLYTNENIQARKREIFRMRIRRKYGTKLCKRKIFGMWIGQRYIRKFGEYNEFSKQFVEDGVTFSKFGESVFPNVQ